MQTATQMSSPSQGKFPPNKAQTGRAQDNEGWLLSLSAAGLLIMALIMAFSISPI